MLRNNYYEDKNLDFKLADILIHRQLLSCPVARKDTEGVRKKLDLYLKINK